MTTNDGPVLSIGQHKLGRPTVMLLLVLALAVVIRLWLFTAICCETDKFFYDSNSTVYYDRIAVNLLNYGVFSHAQGAPYMPDANNSITRRATAS